MNWMSKKTFPSEVSRWLGDARSHLCEHVESDKTIAVAVLCEDDSYGPLGRYCVCKECLAKANAEEAATMHFCRDCKTDKPRSEGIMWTPYDFYPPQGDEELFVCRLCWAGPIHNDRCELDRREQREDNEYLTSLLRRQPLQCPQEDTDGYED